MSHHRLTVRLVLGNIAFWLTSVTYCASITVAVFSTNGNTLGPITFTDSPYGLLIFPKLIGLPQGIHGFHIHQHPNCGNHGMDAGSHFDPQNANSHQGPYGKGHLGDLPVLIVDNTGKATIPMLAPRLTTNDIQGHAIMIHEGGDNYSDNPPLGGGGARIACGEISPNQQ